MLSLPLLLSFLSVLALEGGLQRVAGLYLPGYHDVLALYLPG